MTRILELIVAVVFLAAAVLKALDLPAFVHQVKLYGIVSDPAFVLAGAYGSLAVETVLGALLLAGIRLRGLSYAAAMAVLAGFCVLVAWAWAFNDLKDCGCFGKYIELGPAETIIKNLMTIVLLGVAWALAARRGFQARRPMAVLRGVLAAVAVLAVAIPLAYADGAAATADNNEGSFASYEVGGHRLEEGEYLVAILSSTCDDCAAAVPVLNEFQAFVPDVPVVGLVKGEEQSVRDFRQLNAPEFPLQPIGSAEFFGLTGDYPPRFYLVRDGVAVQYLDTLDVTLGDLLMLAGRE